MPVPGIKSRSKARAIPHEMAKANQPKSTETAPSTLLLPEIDYGAWEEQIVPVLYDDGAKEKYPCKVYGQMCVRLEEDTYRILLKTIWHLVCKVKTEDDALRIGAYLWDNCMMCFMKDTKEEILEALPTWVKPWVKACTAEGKYLDPAPFGG